MKTLILILSPNTPDNLDHCTWLWCDEGGRLLRSGQGGPRNWPQDQSGVDCHLLLGGPAVSCQQLVLPRSPRARTPEVIGGALEESLLEPAEQLCFACWGEADEQGRYRVAVLRRSLLEALLERLRELGHEVKSAWPLGACLPTGQVWEVAGERTWALGDGSFMGFAAEDVLPQEMPGLFVLAEATADEKLPEILARQHQLLVQRPGWLSGDLAPATPSLPWRVALQPALRLAVIFLLLLSMTVLVQWGWMKWQAGQYRTQLEAAFREMSPHEPMLDPLRQSARTIAQLRRLSGQAGDEDFLSLMSGWIDFSHGRDGVVREMRYESGRLTVVGAFSMEQLARLESRVRQRGLSFRTLSDAQDGSRQFLIGARGGE